jgi:hypothetical protein
LDKLNDMKGPEAARMRAERARQLEDFTKQGDAMAIEMIKIREKRELLLIELRESLATLTIGCKVT